MVSGEILNRNETLTLPFFSVILISLPGAVFLAFSIFPKTRLKLLATNRCINDTSGI